MGIMSTYDEVPAKVQRLTPAEQSRLLYALKALVFLPVEVEGDSEEIIPPVGIAESEAAWLDYQAGGSPGISSKDLKLKLFC